jgi:hypothetical protein
MNINFHYAAIKVLARQAGFSLPDSQLIAYASQYVDDATAYNKMAIDRDPGVSDIRYKGGEFDPICTAHKDLDYAKAVLNRRSRLLVYVCFHFVPSLAGTTDLSRRKVAKDGTLAKRMVTDALDAWKAGKSKEEKRRALVKLGVALHSYADTWSHQGFSGYWDSGNNNIGSLEIGRKGRGTKLDVVSQFLSYAAPDIGHAEAGKLPDQSEALWRCKPKKRSVKGENNCTEFIEASYAILDVLSKATKKGKSWRNTKARLRKCFMRPWNDDGFKPSDKSEWRAQFPGLHFDYDAEGWFAGALTAKGGLLDLLGSVSGLDPEDYEVRGGKEYFYFHAAAGQQREAILEAVADLTE